MSGELFGKQEAPLRNVAIKTLTCDCGCQVFRTGPLSMVAYNPLNPGDFMPSTVGAEFQCQKCGKWAALEKTPEQGKLPKWYFCDDKDNPKKPEPKMSLVE